jgi:uncharacterized membrane protein YfcA
MYINPVTATAYSLFVVGFAALVGAIQNIKKGLVDFKTAIVFSIPAFIAVYISRKYIIPAIPENLFTIGDFLVTKNVGIMVFFAMIMVLASFSMIKSSSKEIDTTLEIRNNYPIIIMEGLLVGLITGIVGAGGGFLIIPALVLLVKLPMKKAIATSLLIIAIKSLIGFIGDIENLDIDWQFLALFTSLSVIGIFIGTWLSRFFDGKRLKRGFGWFVLIMAILIIYREFSN